MPWGVERIREQAAGAEWMLFVLRRRGRFGIVRDRAEHHAAAQAGAAVIGREFHDHAGTVGLVAGAVAQRHRIRRGPLREPRRNALTASSLLISAGIRTRLPAPARGARPGWWWTSACCRPRTAARSPVAAAARNRRRCAARPRRAWRGCRVPAGRRAAARSGRSARPSFPRLFEVDREGGDVARIARADARGGGGGRGHVVEGSGWGKGDGIRVRASRRRRATSVIAVLP